MELLGYNLEELACSFAGTFTLPTILFIADQLLDRIKSVHNRFYIHRDIKPENVAIGLENQAKTIFLFDFGLAIKYVNPNTRSHVSSKEGRPLTGTMRYASLNAHFGVEQSRRDDLESLGFTLVYLAKGSLPWQGLEAEDNKGLAKAMLKKMAMTSVDSLCKKLPGTLCNYC
eukprot:TRINITY_DN15190_c0_g1_i1.p1 TRINITY_DN15190_c0_g1~~TRINITY_DN15190_c0_g1_i1.p1  ORF type:complete len:172 (-),score=11.62 TRINITY_DN15190_c0_g1_i1:385-900(-)